jgi:hypothetical protein
MSFPLWYYPFFDTLPKTFSNLFQQLLMSSEKQSKAHNNLKPFLAFKRSPNLKDLLVRARLEPEKVQTEKGYIPCEKSGIEKGCGSCVTCSKHDKIKKSVMAGGATINISNQSYDCESKHVVYILQCKEHESDFYVGETKIHIKRRFYLNRSSAKKSQRCSSGVGGVFAHFAAQHHNDPQESLIITQI